MKKRLLTFGITLFTGCSILAVMVGGLGGAPAAHANDTYQSLPFSQNWNQTDLITTDNDWSGVPGILGYDGRDDSTSLEGTDPQLYLDDLTGTNVVVKANQTGPETLSDQAVAEFHSQELVTGNPVVAIRAQTLYDRPHLLIHLNTTGWENVHVAYLLRDISDAWDEITPVALQYRVGESGDFTNVPGAFVADATNDAATLTTPVSVTLPSAVDNQAQVQLRIITTNADGSDEWVGIDNIVITGDELDAPTPTDGSPTETEPGPTETDPGPTETDPGPTETEPGPTETEPGPTETGTPPTEIPVGENSLYLPFINR